jgi:hypothetical protein
VNPEVRVLFGAVALVLLVPVVLTAVGARRRGSGVVVAALAGLLFPASWALWYVRDEHPYRRPTVDT